MHSPFGWEMLVRGTVGRRQNVAQRTLICVPEAKFLVLSPIGCFQTPPCHVAGDN